MTRSVPVEQIDDIRFLGGIYQEVETAFNTAVYTVQLEAYEQQLAEIHAGYFATDTDPDGDPWKPLAERTVAKKGHATILVDRGDLRASVTDLGHSDHVGEVLDNVLTFGSNATSDDGVRLAPIHQFGLGNVPARKFVGVSDEKLDPLVDAIADAAVEALIFKI